MLDPPGPRSDLALIELHARTLFVHDAADRLVAVNDTKQSLAPRLFLGRTTAGMIWRVRCDLPAGLVARIAALVAEEPASDELERPPACLDAVCAALTEHEPISGREAGPAYCFPPELERPSTAVAVSVDNAFLLERHLPDWLPDAASSAAAGLPMFATVVDGAAVSVCACSRVPGEATEAGVETHPAFRGHGYVGIATAAWAAAVRDRGVVPLYSTSWDNRASQRVAARLGLYRYGASLSIE